MEPQERAIRRRLRDDFPHYAERCLKIRPKGGSLIPFELNAVQRKIHAALEQQFADTGRVRALILKARQPGCSTYVQGRYYWRVTHRPGVRAFILTHRQDATDNIFGMVDRFHTNCPQVVRPQTDAASAKELSFKLLDSGYRVGTAGAAEIGRSETIQYFHGSEVAFWPNADDHMRGVMQAVPEEDGTEVIMESTGNGQGGFFYRYCQAASRGDGEFQVIFIPWHDHEDYRSEPPADWDPEGEWPDYIDLHDLDEEQAYFAYSKNREQALASGESADEISWMFRQEYPAIFEDAFQAKDHDSFIKATAVIRARKAMAADQSNRPLVFGVDTARSGKDKWRILDRRGRCLGHLVDERFACANEMEAAGRIARLIDLHNPDRVFIDVTGGYGAGCYDRLKELNYGKLVSGVNFGAGAADERQYKNKRAEMWGRLRDWLNDPGGADIIDSDELQSDFCAPGYKHTSLGQYQLEAKEKIKERLGHSPDAGDAAALTFAENIRVGAPRRRSAEAATEYDVLRY